MTSGVTEGQQGAAFTPPPTTDRHHHGGGGVEGTREEPPRWPEDATVRTCSDWLVRVCWLFGSAVGPVDLGNHRGARPRLCRRLDSGRETVPAHTFGHTNGQGASNPGAPCSPFSPLGPFLPFFPFSPCGYNHWVKLATFPTFRTAPGLAEGGGGIKNRGGRGPQRGVLRLGGRRKSVKGTKEEKEPRKQNLSSGPRYTDVSAEANG